MINENHPLALAATRPAQTPQSAANPARLPPLSRTKAKYHHGSLVQAAICRGLEWVAESGPMAVTMRGLARDLGVTAAALVHYFHNRAGLRAAIAHAAAEQMRPFTVVRSGGQGAGERLRRTAQAWVDYAGKNPHLYRLVFGEGWREGQLPTPARRECVYSVDRIANLGQMSGHIRAGATKEHGWLFFAAVHGLALARADGAAPSDAVTPLVDRFVRAIEADPNASGRKQARSPQPLRT